MCHIGSISGVTHFLWKTPAFCTLPFFLDSVHTLSLCPAGLDSLPLWDLFCWTLSQHSAQAALPAHALLVSQPFCCIIPNLRVGVSSPYGWMLAVWVVRHKQRPMETVVQITPASKVLVWVRQWSLQGCRMVHGTVCGVVIQGLEWFSLAWWAWWC